MRHDYYLFLQRKRFDRSRHRQRESIFVDDQLDISLNVWFGDREMQAKWRSGMVATDDYAEPIANLLRTIGKPLLRLGKLVGPLVELLLELGGGTATACCGWGIAALDLGRLTAARERGLDRGRGTTSAMLHYAPL